MRQVAIALMGIVLGLSVTGCSAADQVENKITCADVCKRYKDCFNANYDTGACSKQCESQANSSADKDHRLTQCNACIDDKACAAAVFTCATDCAGVIAN